MGEEMLPGWTYHAGLNEWRCDRSPLVAWSRTDGTAAWMRRTDADSTPAPTLRDAMLAAEVAAGLRAKDGQYARWGVPDTKPLPCGCVGYMACSTCRPLPSAAPYMDALGIAPPEKPTVASAERATEDALDGDARMFGVSVAVDPAMPPGAWMIGPVKFSDDEPVREVEHPLAPRGFRQEYVVNGERVAIVGRPQPGIAPVVYSDEPHDLRTPAGRIERAMEMHAEGASPEAIRAAVWGIPAEPRPPPVESYQTAALRGRDHFDHETLRERLRAAPDKRDDMDAFIHAPDLDGPPRRLPTADEIAAAPPRAFDTHSVAPSVCPGCGRQHWNRAPKCDGCARG